MFNNTKSNFDIYLSCNPREVSNQFVNRINSDRWRFHEYIYAPFPSENKHTMEMVKSSSESITVVTVGANLNQRMSDPSYLDCFVNLLELYPNLEWCLIGIKNEEEFLSRNTKLRSLYTLGKVKLIKFEEDLLSFYRFCDIYAFKNAVIRISQCFNNHMLSRSYLPQERHLLQASSQVFHLMTTH